MRRVALIGAACGAVLALGLAIGVTSWAQSQSMGSHVGDYRAGFSGGSLSSACPESVTGDRTCVDNNGVSGGQRTSTTDPESLGIRPQVCAPGDGTCTAANLNLFGGQDTSTIAIDGADPSASCAGDNDTVTVTVVELDGTSTATVLAEGTDWTASASVSDTCTSLASAVDALDGVGASCTSPDVRITLDSDTGRVTLAESTAGCTTVATRTVGDVTINATYLFVDQPGGTHGTDSARIGHNGTTAQVDSMDGALQLRSASGVAVSTLVGGNTTFSVTGSIGTSGTNIAALHIGVIYFCGQGPNGATTVYLSPRSSGLFGDATCDDEDSTTESAADEVWAPFDFKPVSMECGITDVAADNGVTFALRDDTADVAATLTCTTAALDGSGYASCDDIVGLTAAPTVAAGSAIAMRAVATSANLTLADIWCRVTVSY